MTGERGVPGAQNRARSRLFRHIAEWLLEEDGVARDYCWPTLFGVAVTVVSNIGLNYSTTYVLKISSDRLVESVAWGILGSSIWMLYRMVKKVRQNTRDIPQTVRTSFEDVSRACICRLADQMSYISTLVRTGSNIEDFHPDHIRYFHDLVNGLPARGWRRIIATDSSLAHQWWQNSMIGYLAIQTRVRPPGGVSRLFVWSPAEIGDNEGRKLIMLHQFLGFETYVITVDAYREFLKEQKGGDIEIESACNRDFLVFEGADVGLDKMGYKSRWEVFTNHTEREQIDEAAHSALWFDSFERPAQIESCISLFKRIEEDAIDFAGYPKDVRCIEDMLCLHQCRPIRLKTMDVYDLRKGLERFKGLQA